MASNYCFGSFDDAGKLMGLAPYGNSEQYNEQLFRLEDGRVFVNEEVMHHYFTRPADYVTRPFYNHFQYYADIARWVQDEAERAILYIIQHRLQFHPHKCLSYAGGVALNAVANAKFFSKQTSANYILSLRQEIMASLSVALLWMDTNIKQGKTKTQWQHLFW